MKKVFAIVLLAMLMLSAVITVDGHSGGTDGSGGHYDSSTGQYHYHHGYPAHQHTNGECPYNYDDNTIHRSTSSNDVPWYVYVVAISACVAVFVLDYKMLDGKIAMFLVSLPISITALLLHILGLIWRFVEWIIKKIRNDNYD